jgi:WD40 repeat protein/serine/threonine protein kinase
VENQIGKVLKSYELEELIGTGGFGAVYRAKQASVSREVAVKIIWPAFANHPNFIRRFEAEAQLVAGLEHPYIVPLYDYWRDTDGAYIVMRWLRGGHLRQMLKGKPLSLKQIDHILQNITNALALAHRFGVVHRDIKPENILMDEDGNAYLADFGIAQILNNSTGQEDDFSHFGSPAYASPEQMKGNLTTSQSDIYSLGIVLFEMLTGEHPFPELAELTMSEILSYRSNLPLPPLISRRTDLPAALNDVLQRATAIETKLRYPDALSFAYAFREAIGSTNGGGGGTKLSDLPSIIPNPYRGLRAFQENDATVFFGREALVRRLMNRLWENEEYSRFLAVVGPSGSGKSSVVRAGLIPLLRQGGILGSEDWYYNEFTPGTAPFEELSTLIESIAIQPIPSILQTLTSDKMGLHNLILQALPDDESEVFLLIDQFEEVFTLNQNDAEIDRFIESLYSAVVASNSRLRLVITIRADFYDRPLLQPIISDLVRERTEVVVPLTASELERVIVEPARKVGVNIDNALVAGIIAEVQEQPGALPLLQYALTELFEHREGSMITLQAYREIGGVRGALARRADEIYSRLDESQQVAVRQLFLRLINLGEGTEDTRRRALLSELTNLHDSANPENGVIMKTVVDTLGQARLLTFDRDPITRTPTVEVTHEAIIREWGKLRSWLDDSRNDVRLQRALSSLAQEWYNANRELSFLLRGIRLQQYERWLQTTNLALTEQERVYLNASLSERMQLEAEERKQQEKERAQEQFRVRALVAGIVFAMLVAVGAVALTAFALQQSQRAEESAQLAQESANVSRSVALASSALNALSNDDQDLALVLALEANVIPNAPIESQASLAQVALAQGTRRLFEGHQASVTSAALNNTMSLIASASADASIRLWDANSGELIREIRGHRGDVLSVQFSADGQSLVSSGADFLAIVWNVNTGEERLRLTAHTAPVEQVLFTPDGTRIITGAGDGLVIVWDAQSGAELQRFTLHTAPILSFVINNSNQILSGSRDGRVLLWDYTTGEIIQELITNNTSLTSLNLNSDSTQAVTAFADGTISVWNMSNGQILTRLQGITTEITSATFTSDNQYLLTATQDSKIYYWNLSTSTIVNILTGHRQAVNQVRVMGELAVSASLDTTVRLWNIGNSGALGDIGEVESRINELVLNENIYIGTADGHLHIKNSQGEPLADYLYTDLPISALAISADNQTALIGSRDGIINVVSLTDGIITRMLEGHSGNVLDMATFSDNERAVSSSQNGEIIIWNWQQGTELNRFTIGESAIQSIRLSDDEQSLFVGASDYLVYQIRVTDGEVIRTFTGLQNSIYDIDVNSEGTLVAAAGRDGFVLIWDVASGVERARLPMGTDSIWAVRFNPSGDKIAVATTSGAIVIWDITTTQDLQQFDANNRIFGLVFNESGTVLYSGGEDSAVQSWRVFNGMDAIAWANENRYIRPVDCLERQRFRIEPYCQ